MPQPDNHLCLCHIAPGGHKHLRLMPSEELETLVGFRQPGDTLHKVPDAVRLDIYLLMAHIEDQLTRGECVKLT